jgi:hypothetical protein
MEKFEIDLFLKQLRIIRIFLSNSGKPAMSATVSRAIILICELITKSNTN